MAGITGPCPNCRQQITAPAQHMASPCSVQQTATPIPQPLLAAQPPAPVHELPQLDLVPPLQRLNLAAAPILRANTGPTPGLEVQTTLPSPSSHPAMPSAENRPMNSPSTDRPARGPGDGPLAKRPESRQPSNRSNRRSRSEGPSAQATSTAKKLIGMLLAVAVLIVGGTLAKPKLMEIINSGTTPAPQPRHVEGAPTTNEAPKSKSTTPRVDDEKHLVDNTLPLLEDKKLPVPPFEDDPIEPLEGILDQPRDFLAQYITSPEWTDLIPKSVGDESLEQDMAAYYEKYPYKPEDLVEMTFQHKQKLPDSDFEFYLFKVITESNKRSFPMTVEETGNGFRTDWLTYVQFKDMHLQKFLKNPDINTKSSRGETQVFNVILRRAHDFTNEVPDSDNKWCYRIDAPVDANNGEELGGYSFIPKHSKYGQEINSNLKWLLSYFPIVELRWEVDADYPERPYVRLMKIRQFNWRGHDPKAKTLETVSAGQQGS